MIISNDINIGVKQIDRQCSPVYDVIKHFKTTAISTKIPRLPNRNLGTLITLYLNFMLTSFQLFYSTLTI